MKLLFNHCVVIIFLNYHFTATEWCQRYLSCYLLPFFNSVCFSSIYRSLGRLLQRTIGIYNIEHWTLPKIWVSTFLVRSFLVRSTIQGKLCIDSKRKNGN